MKCLDSPGRPFRFLNVLAEHRDFLPTVDRCWQVTITGKPMFRLWQHCKMIKQELKAMHKDHFSRVAERRILHRDALEQAQLIMTGLMLNCRLRKKIVWLS